MKKGDKPTGNDLIDFLHARYGPAFDATMPLTPLEWLEQLEDDLIALSGKNICGIDVNITITIKTTEQP